VLAVVVTLASTATAASAAVGSFTVGDTTHRITTASERPANSDVRMGSLTLDLTELTLTEDTTITASVGMGELIIELPTDVDAEVQWQVGLGEATVPGDTFNGPNLGGTYRQDRQSTARLTIVADVGMGEVTVR
jgi:predicted membrane protein